MHKSAHKEQANIMDTLNASKFWIVQVSSQTLILWQKKYQDQISVK